MWDYIVVGAGSAGCAVAARLSEDAGTQVLLLEAGPHDRVKEVRIPAAFSKLFRSQRDWAFETEPQAALGGRSVFFPRGRTLGGCSAINAQMWVPGEPADHADWPEGWRWADVRPWYERIERGPGTISAQRDPNPMSRAFVAAAAQRGIGAELVRVTQRNGLRCSAATAYLRPARRRRNLTVRTGAHAVAVAFDGMRAVGVRHRRGGREETAHARHEVILCAGAIGSPQLLLLSGVGPEAELREHGLRVVCDLPEVGRGLRDHVMAIALFAATGAASLYAAEAPRQLGRLLLRRRGLLTSNVGEAAAFLRSRPELAAPDLELLFAPVLYLDEGLSPPDAHGFSIGAVALRPASRGAVTLRSADPVAPPRIHPAYLSEPEDVRVLAEGVRRAREVAGAEPLARWLASERAPGGDDDLEGWVRASAQTLYHPVGTCAIGPVLDAGLRVRGLEGLRVVDASAVPELPRGHTHAVTTMLAERAADMIRRPHAEPLDAGAAPAAGGVEI